MRKCLFLVRIDQMFSSEESEDDNWGLLVFFSGFKMERCFLGKIEFLFLEVMLEQVNLYILKICVFVVLIQFYS